MEQEPQMDYKAHMVVKSEPFPLRTLSCSRFPVNDIRMGSTTRIERLKLCQVGL